MVRPTKKVRVAVFGIFDGVHDGHRDLFGQARRHGDELIVIVGRDEAAVRVKNKKPRHPEEKRLELIAREPGVSHAILGDKTLSTYCVLEELKPDVICLGYDQQELGEDLRKWMNQKGKEIAIRFLKPYEPNRLHNSLLNL